MVMKHEKHYKLVPSSCSTNVISIIIIFIVHCRVNHHISTDLFFIIKVLIEYAL